MTLEAIDLHDDDGELQPYRDPLDSVGARCQAEHEAIGKCHRRFDHVNVDPWHHAMTDSGDRGHNAQYWRWRDDA